MRQRASLSIERCTTENWAGLTSGCGIHMLLPVRNHRIPFLHSQICRAGPWDSTFSYWVDLHPSQQAETTWIRVPRALNLLTNWDFPTFTSTGGVNRLKQIWDQTCRAPVVEMGNAENSTHRTTPWGAFAPHRQSSHFSQEATCPQSKKWDYRVESRAVVCDRTDYGVLYIKIFHCSGKHGLN